MSIEMFTKIFSGLLNMTQDIMTFMQTPIIDRLEYIMSAMGIWDIVQDIIIEIIPDTFLNMTFIDLMIGIAVPTALMTIFVGFILKFIKALV